MPIDKMRGVAVPASWTLDAYLNQHKQLIDRRLAQLPQLGDRETLAATAARAALESPGKRFRGLLVIATADIFEQGQKPQVLDMAAAVECIHLASLVLDDLPSMDDAKLRRGHPTLHRRFGEAQAILSAMALIAEAHHLVAQRDASRRLFGGKSAGLSALLARSYSLDGLTGGQSDDLGLRQDLSLQQLEFIHAKKTGTLFILATQLACRICQAKAHESKSLSAYAQNLGLAFQIKDDLLDATGSEVTGKDSGQDRGKTTFVTLMGQDACSNLYEELMQVALSHLDGFGSAAHHLRALTNAIWHRVH